MVYPDTQRVFFRLLEQLSEKSNCPLTQTQTEYYIDIVARYGFEKSILAISAELDDYVDGQPIPSASQLERRILATKP